MLDLTRRLVAVGRLVLGCGPAPLCLAEPEPERAIAVADRLAFIRQQLAGDAGGHSLRPALDPLERRLVVGLPAVVAPVLGYVSNVGSGSTWRTGRGRRSARRRDAPAPSSPGVPARCRWPSLRRTSMRFPCCTLPRGLSEYPLRELDGRLIGGPS
jgi:hypothetical protein